MTELYDFLAEKISKSIEKYHINSICDYGCGNGELLIKIKELIPYSLTLTGIDYFNKFSDENKPAPDISNINFIDKESESFKEISKQKNFDLIISTFALHHFQYPVSELKTMYSMLNNGGIIQIIDFSFNNETNVQIVKNLICYIDEFLRATKKQYHRHHYTLEEIIDLSKAIDMEIIEAYETTFEETEEQKIENFHSYLELNKKKVLTIQNEPEIYQEIFSDLFKLEYELLKKYKFEYGNLLIISLKKENKDLTLG